MVGLMGLGFKDTGIYLLANGMDPEADGVRSWQHVPYNRVSEIKQPRGLVDVWTATASKLKVHITNLFYIYLHFPIHSVYISVY